VIIAAKPPPVVCHTVHGRGDVFVLGNQLLFVIVSDLSKDCCNVSDRSVVVGQIASPLSAQFSNT